MTRAEVTGRGSMDGSETATFKWMGHATLYPEAPFESEAGFDSAIAAVLMEQLQYLIRFADRERDRLERVRDVLMEPFA